MPSYISHSIMADELHDKLNLEGIETNRKSLRTYSLLPDLASTLAENHNTKVKDYIIYLIRTIKDNNLIEDPNILSLLYGTISHYFLDKVTHPYIYYFDFQSETKSPISSHYYIEGYFNYVLSDKVLHSNIMLVKPEFSTAGTITQKGKELIEKSYQKIYGVNILSTIKKNLALIKKLEYLYKRLVKDNGLLASITGFNSFLEYNQLTPEILDNRNHNIWINPFTNETSSKSFLELYNQALYECIEAISLIQKYFKGYIPLSTLENLFTCSYDTGIDKPLGLYKKNNEN